MFKFNVWHVVLKNVKIFTLCKYHLKTLKVLGVKFSNFESNDCFKFAVTIWSIRLQPTLYVPLFYENWVYNNKEYWPAKDFRCHIRQK